MSNVPDIIDIEMMTPGSVWINKKGKRSRFLHATNRHLPDHLQEIYPPMAIYADEDNNILSVPVEDFLSKRKFYNVDPDLEARVNNVLPDADDEATQFSFDEDDGDSLLISDDDGDESNVQGTIDEEIADSNLAGASIFDSDEPEAGSEEYQVTYSAEGTGLPEVIAPSILSRHTEGYSQEPMMSEGKIKHTLFVRAGFGITMDTLRSSFHPDNAEINAVYTFKANTDEGIIDVDWDTFVGVFPMTRGQQTLYQLIFTTFAPMHYEVPNTEVAKVADPVNVPEVDTVLVMATPTVTAQTLVAVQQAQAAGAPAGVVVAQAAPTVIPTVSVAPVVGIASTVSVAPAA